MLPNNCIITYKKVSRFYIARTMFDYEGGSQVNSKFLIYAFLILNIFIMVACSQTIHKDKSEPKNGDYPNNLTSKAEVTQGDFIFRIVSKKEKYNEGEPINLYSELEYIGRENEVTIFHAASPFYFPIEEMTRGYRISYPMNEPLLTTILKKGEPYRQAYGKAGGYSEEEDKEYVAFMKRFLTDKGFPNGHYVVTGIANFYIESEENNENKQDYNMKANIEFIVEE
jgi:hypothetical protein